MQEAEAAGMVKAAEELSTIVFELAKELVFVGEPGAEEAAVVAAVFAKAELEVEEAVPGAARWQQVRARWSSSITPVQPPSSAFLSHARASSNPSRAPPTAT